MYVAGQNAESSTSTMKGEFGWTCGQISERGWCSNDAGWGFKLEDHFLQA